MPHSDSLRWRILGWRAAAGWLGKRDEWHRDFLPPLFAFLAEITVSDEDAIRSFLAGVAPAAFLLMAHAVDAMERATFGLLLRLLSVYLKVFFFSPLLKQHSLYSLSLPLHLISSALCVHNSAPSFARR